MVERIIPISALIPTRNRSKVLTKTLESLANQSVQPAEIIVIDGSDDNCTLKLCTENRLNFRLRYYPATTLGAAAQRNQAMSHATQDMIWLLDDDIILEPECLLRLWAGLQSDPEMGAVNAMITNQRYLPPGQISRMLFQFLHGQIQDSYAGQCIGPAFNLLPEDRDDLPELVPVEWLNTTCTLYRREALPNPLFPGIFTGYSLMEDVYLSLMVAKRWKIANARTARIFHDSQPGDHKNNPGKLAQMELVNRHYVMTQVLGRKTPQDYVKLMVLQLFEIAASLQSAQGWLQLPGVLQGKILGTSQIIRSHFSSNP